MSRPLVDGGDHRKVTFSLFWEVSMSRTGPGTKLLVFRHSDVDTDNGAEYWPRHAGDSVLARTW